MIDHGERSGHLGAHHRLVRWAPSTRHTEDSAPVRAARSVHIDASPERVWDVLCTAVDWPSVDAAISNVQVTGGVAEDALFAWTNGKARSRARFAIVDPDGELTWTGQRLGAKALHRQVLHQADDREVVDVPSQPDGRNARRSLD